MKKIIAVMFMASPLLALEVLLFIYSEWKEFLVVNGVLLTMSILASFAVFGAFLFGKE